MNNISKRTEYPDWVCLDCGNLYGKKSVGFACWHMDTCGVCGEHKEVTEPRDFCHLKDGWQNHKKINEAKNSI